MTRTLIASLALVGSLALSAQQPPSSPAPQSQQPSEISTVISSGDIGAPPRFAVPDFIAMAGASARDRTADAETADAARTIARVLWDDLNFEHEFALIPRDVYKTIPPATSMTDVPLDRWRELNADGVVIGSVQKTDAGVRVEVRLFNVRSGQSAFNMEYSGSIANVRVYAHTIADDIHKTQRNLRGVARTRLTFNSDRDGERLSGTIENRGAKEIYISDYDGENQRRMTVNRDLNSTSVWAPDGRSIAYVSWRRGPPNIFLSNIYSGLAPQDLTKSVGNNWTPVFSPDGTRIAFSSNRDGNPEIYVMNRDGSNVRRLTNHPANDITPTWSPSGTQIAFTSEPRRRRRDLHHGLRRRRYPEADQRLLGPPDVVPGAVQRDRVRRQNRAGQRHPGHRPRDRPGAATDLRRGDQREPGVRAERTAHRLQLDPIGQGTDFHDRPRRQGPQATHSHRQQQTT